MFLRCSMLSLAVLMFMEGGAQASQGEPMPECRITGKVISETYRKEAGQGMSEGQTFWYHDIAIKLSADKRQNSPSCNESNKVHIYQMRDGVKASYDDDETPPTKRIGTCISATTKFHADGNFMSGNWIYNIVEAPDASCN